MSKYYKISEWQLIQLLKDSMILNCLERDGVDNWDYYGEGFKQDIEERVQALGLPLYSIIEGTASAVERYEYDYEDIAKQRLQEYELIL